jgi:5'-deoxynucleotidase YfbR-like HD superfamily hydrolase
MPVYKSIEAVIADIQKKMEYAIIKSQEQVYQIIDRFVKEYYSEWSPEFYERTYQLYKSLVKSEIEKTSNGYKARVYFDLDKLDYYMKTFNGEPIPNKGWSEEKTLWSAAHGWHGGQRSGTAIYDEPIAVLNSEGIEILKRMLIESGILIK